MWSKVYSARWCYNMIDPNPGKYFRIYFVPERFQYGVHGKIPGSKVVSEILTHKPKDNLNVLHIYYSVSAFLSPMPSFWFWSSGQSPVENIDENSLKYTSNMLQLSEIVLGAILWPFWCVFCLHPLPPLTFALIIGKLSNKSKLQVVLVLYWLGFSCGAWEESGARKIQNLNL